MGKIITNTITINVNGDENGENYGKINGKILIDNGEGSTGGGKRGWVSMGGSTSGITVKV